MNLEQLFNSKYHFKYKCFLPKSIVQIWESTYRQFFIPGSIGVHYLAVKIFKQKLNKLNENFRTKRTSYFLSNKICFKWLRIYESLIIYIYYHLYILYLSYHLFITSRVYLEPTSWPPPSWLVSSVGRALHRYRRGHGFKSRTGLNFFQALFSLLPK